MLRVESHKKINKIKLFHRSSAVKNYASVESREASTKIS